MTAGMQGGNIDQGIPVDLPRIPGYDPEKQYRSGALAALRMMKQLEKEKMRDMRTVRLDARTVVSATKGRLEEILEDHDRRQDGIRESDG